MTPLQLQLCDIQGRLFVLSTSTSIESDVFISSYMTSKTCEQYDAPYNRLQWAGEEYILEEVIDECEKHNQHLSTKKISKNSLFFTKDELYWMGYFYRCWHFLTGETSKEIYRQAPVRTMKKMYPGFHTIDESIAIENLKSFSFRPFHFYAKGGLDFFK